MKNTMAFAYEEIIDAEENTQLVNPDVRVAFILINKFTLAPVTGLVESLRFAADRSFRSFQIYCKWDWMTFDNQPVSASCGLSINPTKAFDLHDLKHHYDYIVIAGGLMSETRHPPQGLVNAIKALHDAKIPIISLCSSSFVLGKAGILDGRKCAVHFTIRDEFIQNFPKAVALLDKSYVEDDGIFTCPGGTAIDLATQLIRQHCGEVRARKGLEYLLIHADQQSSSHDFSVFTDPTAYENTIVSHAIEFMKNNLSAHFTLKEVALHVQTSPRQLHRVFVANTNESPAHYWRRLRLERSRTLLSNTSAYVTNIAVECGFSDASHFIFLFKKQYGETPYAYRKRRHEVEKIH